MYNNCTVVVLVTTGNTRCLSFLDKNRYVPLPVFLLVPYMSGTKGSRILEHPLCLRISYYECSVRFILGLHDDLKPFPSSVKLLSFVGDSHTGPPLPTNLSIPPVTLPYTEDDPWVQPLLPHPFFRPNGPPSRSTRYLLTPSSPDLLSTSTEDSGGLLLSNLDDVHARIPSVREAFVQPPHLTLQ